MWCFYCNVDSTELKVYLVGIVALLFLSVALFFIGLALKGKTKLKDIEKIKETVLEAEDDES